MLDESGIICYTVIIMLSMNTGCQTMQDSGLVLGGYSPPKPPRQGGDRPAPASLLYRQSVFIRLPRKLEKCQIPQDILCLTKRLDRRNTVCIARERLKVRCKRDNEDDASEVSEEV
jgi:hypothetical protein